VIYNSSSVLPLCIDLGDKGILHCTLFCKEKDFNALIPTSE
jgi:hypothetical protein